MEPGVKLSVWQLQEYNTEEGYINTYMPTQKLILGTGQHQPHRAWRHKVSGYEKERGPIVVW